MVGDIQPLSRLQVTCIAEENGNRQVGTFGGGGRIGLGYFQQDQRYLQYRHTSGAGSDSQSGCRRCAGRRHAGRAWQGDGPGILLHEAIGHGLEADFNRKKTSAFSSLLGKQVASESARSSTMDASLQTWLAERD